MLTSSMEGSIIDDFFNVSESNNILMNGVDGAVVDEDNREKR